MESKPILDIMIATHGENGLSKVAEMSLPQIPGVRYLVGCQSLPCPTPSILERDDVEIHFTDSKGLSANRNFLLGLTSAPYGLIADNDLNYTSNGIASVIKAMNENPDIDIATFRHKSPKKKVYPPEEWDISKKYKNYYITSMEICIRINAFKEKNIMFDERMSIGTPYISAGEEEIFITKALNRNLTGRFFPITICEHPLLHTLSQKGKSSGALRAKGVVVQARYPFSSIPRLLLYAKRDGGNYFRNLKYMMQGWLWAIKNRRTLV